MADVEGGETVSKNEQKRRQKAELKAKQAAEKEAAKVGRCGWRLGHTHTA